MSRHQSNFWVEKLLWYNSCTTWTIHTIFPWPPAKILTFPDFRGKDKALDTCCSATYISQTRDQQRFTILEVATDWHEPMVLKRITWPSIACANGQLDPASRHTITPSATVGLHLVAIATTHFPSRWG